MYTVMIGCSLQAKTAQFVVSQQSTTHTTKVLVVRRTIRPRQRNPVYNLTSTACLRSLTLLQVHKSYHACGRWLCFRYISHTMPPVVDFASGNTMPAVVDFASGT